MAKELELSNGLAEFAVWLEGKKVGSDIDGVNTDTATAAVESFNNKFGTSYKKKDLKSYFEMAQWIVKITRNQESALEEAINLWNSQEIILGAYPESGSWILQDHLYRHGVNSVFVTSRPGYNRQWTKEWFERWMPWVSPTMIFQQTEGSGINHGFKAQTVASLGLDVMFEDSVRDALEVVKVSPRTLVSIVPQPWNVLELQERTDLNPRIIYPRSKFDFGRPPLWEAYINLARHLNFI